MKKFILTFIVVIAPIFIICVIILYVLIGSKESLSVSEAIEYQNKTLGLYSCQSRYIDNVYKLNKTIEVKADVLALGTSRVMQISSNSFVDTSSFYNAGGAISNIHHFVPFLKRIQYSPRILLISLDQYFFNADWLKTQSTDPQLYSNTEDDLYNIILSSSLMILKNIFTGNISIPIPESKNIGLDAIVKSNGFRVDGTRRYGEWEISPELLVDYNFKDTYQRIKNGNSRFEYGSEIKKESIAHLIKLIEYCSNNDIYLIAFLPPYAPSVWDHMMESGKYTYTNMIYDNLLPLFNDRDFALFDFSSGDISSSIDSEYVDGFHGGPAVYKRIVEEIASKNKVFRSVCNFN